MEGITPKQAVATGERMTLMLTATKLLSTYLVQGVLKAQTSLQYGTITPSYSKRTEDW